MREAYEEHLKWFRIEANTLKKAEAKAEVAKNLLKSGLSVDLISAATGLTLEHINSYFL